jgi:hypothetical protein
MRAESELSRCYDMLKTAKRGTLTDKQVNLFIATIAVLDLEAKTLKVSVPLRLRLSNLSIGPVPSQLSEALFLVKYFLNPNAAWEFRLADK